MAKPNEIKGARIVRINNDGVSAPCIVYDGEEPAKGSTIKFELDNGVTYSGKVADVTSADGNVLVEFKDGIVPVPEK